MGDDEETTRVTTVSLLRATRRWSSNSAKRGRPDRRWLRAIEIDTERQQRWRRRRRRRRRRQRRARR